MACAANGTKLRSPAARSKLCICLHISCWNRGRRVYMEDPGYPGARNAWKQAGATVIPLPVDDEGIRLPEGKTLPPALIYVTPSHQFPLGTCMSLGRRLSLLQAAREAGHGSSKMIMTRSFATRVPRSPACRAWISIAASFTLAPSARPFSLRFGWHMRCCHQPCWRNLLH